MTTEPTDDELAKLFTEETGFDVDDFPAAILDFARAVLARRGQPSGAGEVVYQASYKDGFWQDCSRERYEYLKAPKISSSVDWTSRILYTAPQPIQAQAGAVPLTPEQIERAAKKLAECMDYPWGHMPTIGREEMRIHARAVLEAAHGIKGKEAGNAE